MFRILLFLLLAAPAFSQKWQPVDGHLLTDFAQKVTPENAWQEYPRPQMVRGKWLNLNGLWQYAIVGKDAPKPAVWQGNILVPFPTAHRPSRIEKVAIGFSSRSARFVKIVAENVRVCPDWHAGKGSACWVFVDEVRVSD